MNQQSTILGRHAFNSLTSLFSTTHRQSILLVVDEVAYKSSGAHTRLEPLLATHETTRFSEFEPNPKMEDVLKGIKVYRQCQPTTVLAIGGGTTIDVAKLICTLATSTAPIEVVKGTQPLARKTNHLIAVPTTAGTGSEATQFAVVYVDGQKFSLDDPSLLPEMAIIDPCLMLNLPPAITASTGLDALCQAIESIWSVNATKESIQFAREAIELSIENLVIATNAPTLASREAMCRASHLAGRAINRTRTTACHALSYSLTSTYGLPHGIEVALTLAPMLRYNAAVSDEDCMDPRGVRSVRKRIGIILKALQARSVVEGCDVIHRLLKSLDCPANLTDAGIGSSSAIRRMISSVNVQRMSNNPRFASDEDLFQLLYQGSGMRRRPAMLPV